MTTVGRRPNRRKVRAPLGERIPRPYLLPRARDLVHRPALRQRVRALRMSDAWFAGWVLLWAACIAVLAVAEQWQMLATFVWVPAFAMLFVQWPVIGTVSLFALWTFAPFLRRVLDVVDPTSSGPDVLSLTPFMATGSVAVLAFMKYAPPKKLNLYVAVVLAGFAIGIPMGLSAPFALVFGIFAYASAILGVYIGYANGRERRFTLEQLLLPMVLLSSLYGVWQGLLPRLPVWDQTWLLTSNFGSVGTKELGTFRVFSVLNSPYTYASLVAVYLAMLFVSRKISLLRIATIIVALIGIFLTQSRGAWVSVAGGLVILTFFTGGRALPRLAGLLLMLVGMYVALGSSPAGQQVVSRASSISAGTNDKSGSDRKQAILSLGPQAVTRPLGAGIGSVGAASDLNPSPPASLVDNGYLIMLYQVGPIGFVLVGWGILGLIRTALRGTTSETRRPLLPLLAPIGVFVPLSLFSETLYGLPGFILFYALGEALGRRYTAPPPDPAAEGRAPLTAPVLPPLGTGPTTRAARVELHEAGDRPGRRAA
ncbi:MAG: O-antigen ligase family protein [Patulibacter minatonensis]